MGVILTFLKELFTDPTQLSLLSLCFVAVVFFDLLVIGEARKYFNFQFTILVDW